MNTSVHYVVISPATHQTLQLLLSHSPLEQLQCKGTCDNNYGNGNTGDGTDKTSEGKGETID